MYRPKLLEEAILIVAHPDDEIIWFSSILELVRKIIICFAPKDKVSFENLTKEYPLDNVEFIKIPSFGSYHRINFNFPILNKYGIFIKHSLAGYMRYKRNFKLLLSKLDSIIPEESFIFTHNPWGEYGHEEHIQLSRILESLETIKNLKIWYNNYGGFKNYGIIKRYLFSCEYELLTLPSNKSLARDLKDFYIRKGLWTFCQNWEWPDEEIFFTPKRDTPLGKYKVTIPINFLNVRW